MHRLAQFDLNWNPRGIRLTAYNLDEQIQRIHGHARVDGKSAGQRPGQPFLAQRVTLKETI
jgi:hypothetical protein